jgi:hypothetical protein
MTHRDLALENAERDGISPLVLARRDELDRQGWRATVDVPPSARLPEPFLPLVPLGTFLA